MSTIIGSTGKFGTSMDYSQLLEIRRKYLNVNKMKNVNPTNTPTIKPYFNQDRLTSGSNNGSSEFYNQRGLFTLFKRVR